MAYTYKIEFSYDGKNFYGFQRQANLRSVQGELEKSLTRLNKQRTVEISASGRTDAKVHAYKQVAHFKVEDQLNLEYFTYALNRLLDNDIYVKDVQLVNNKFHARYDVSSKVYLYKINIGEYNVFESDYALQLNKTLDLEKMQEACTLLVGCHDFRTFTSALDRQNTKKEIYSITITQKNDIISIEYFGNGFLRYMIRKLTNALIEIGLHKLELSQLQVLLDKKDIKAYSKVIGGQGLYLKDVRYEGVLYE